MAVNKGKINMEFENKGKAVLYCRFSCSKQNEKSIEDQRRECTEFCKRKGLSIINEYDDEALSGRTDNRPSFMKLINDSRKRQWNYVVVWKLDRFARNRYDSAIYKRKLKLNGVKVVSATEEIPDTPEGIMLETMMEGWAEYYSADLSQKMKRAVEGNLLKGKLSGTRPPFGFVYDKGKLSENTKESPILRMMFEDYGNTGMSLTDLVNKLNGQGLRTAKGNKWSVAVLAQMFQNRKYIGEYMLYGITRNDICQQLISTELFNKVQLKLAVNRRGGRGRVRKGTDYLLFGKAYCGLCGTHMVGSSSTRKYKKFRYYNCAIHRDPNNKEGMVCKGSTTGKDLIESEISRNLLVMLSDKELLKRAVDIMFTLQDSKNPLAETIEKAISENENKINNLVNVLSSGFSSEAIKSQLTELESQRKELSKQMEEYKEKHKIFTKEQLAAFYSPDIIVKANTKEVQRKIIACFVKRVIFNGDKTVDVFLFDPKDGEKKVNYVKRIDLDKCRAEMKGMRYFRLQVQDLKPVAPDCTKSAFYALRGGGLMLRISIEK